METQPTYYTRPDELDRRTLLPITHNDYRAPDHDDVRKLKELSGKTGGELAALTGVDPRSFRKWSAPPEASNSQRIPYSAWRLLLLETGFAKPIISADQVIDLNELTEDHLNRFLDICALVPGQPYCEELWHSKKLPASYDRDAPAKTMPGRLCVTVKSFDINDLQPVIEKIASLDPMGKKRITKKA